MKDQNLTNEADVVYSNLLFFSPFAGEVVAEKKYPYLYLTEGHIQVMWLVQKYFKNLKTTDGAAIEVISPGIWNCEAGPDFLKAQLSIGGVEVTGDIALHLSDEEWVQHRHHEDPRYNEVVLHLSLWESKKPKKMLKQNNKEALQAYLERYLTIKINRILNLIDLDFCNTKKK